MNNYLKAIVIGLSAFTLAACATPVEKREETRSSINEKLPDGCKFNYYGTYATAYNYIHVGAVICTEGSGLKATSTNLNWDIKSGNSIKLGNSIQQIHNTVLTP